jgi:hypothetical protein
MMKWNTFDGWFEEGYGVKKGEKSVLRQPDGKPLFNENQVLNIDDERGDEYVAGGAEWWKD